MRRTILSHHGFSADQVAPRVGISSHRHDEIELNLPEGGTVTYRFGGEPVLLQPGRLAVFWAGRVHSITACSALRLTWITIPISMWLDWRLPDPLGSAVLAGQMVMAPRAEAGDPARFAAWCADLDQGGTVVQAAGLEIHARLLRLAGAGGTVRRVADQDAAGRVARLLVARFTERLTIRDLAGVADLHPHHLNRAFRLAFGTTVHAYLTGLRLAEAKRLLAEGVAARDAGLAAGFGSTAAFYASFTAKFGMSPGKWVHAAGLSGN